MGFGLGFKAGALSVNIVGISSCALHRLRRIHRASARIIQNTNIAHPTAIPSISLWFRLPVVCDTDAMLDPALVGVDAEREGEDKDVEYAMDEYAEVDIAKEGISGLSIMGG